MHRFIVTIYSRSIRRCYDIVIDAMDAAEAWVHAEWILGCDCGCNRSCVHQVRPAI